MDDLFRDAQWALSLWQPWASLWIATMPRLKRHETRHWPAPRNIVGRRILVHAAKTRDGIRNAHPDLADICASEFGGDWETALPLGGVIGSVLLCQSFRITERDEELCAKDDKVDHACGDWTPGRYAWPGDDPIAFPLVPFRGQQGFWRVPAEGR